MSCLSRISNKIHVPCSPIIKQTQNFWANCSKTVKVAAVAGGLFGASAAVYFGIKGPVFWSAQKIFQVMGVGVATSLGLRFINNLYPQAVQRGIQLIGGDRFLGSSESNQTQPAAQVFGAINTHQDLKKPLEKSERVVNNTSVQEDGESKSSDSNKSLPAAKVFGEINSEEYPDKFIRTFSSNSKDSYTKEEVEANLIHWLKQNGENYKATAGVVKHFLDNEPEECFIFSLNGVQEKLIIRLREECALLTDATLSFAKVYLDQNYDIKTLFEYDGCFISKREQQFCLHAGPNSYEHIDYAQFQNKTEQPQFWDKWKEKCPEANGNYVGSIYPSVLESLSSLIKQNSVIVEIAGGDGVFAEQVLTSPQSEKISEYHLIDLNEVSLEKARARKIEKMTVTTGDITKPFLSDKKEEVDLVIGVGALTTQVLPSHQSAIEGLRQARSILKKGGHLILSGHAKTFISSIDLEREGFLVKQVYDPKRGIYLYVAQKKD